MITYNFRTGTVHMMGEYVGVSEDKEPYISFPVIGKGHDGQYYRSEDMSVQGGISLEEAKILIKELQEAIAFMESL